MKKISIAAVVFLLSSAHAEPATPTLSPTSYGQVSFGARLETVEKNLSEKGRSNTPDDACKYVVFSVYPKAKFMVEDGIIVRADVEPGVPNTLGIPVGISLAEAKKKYPSVKIEEHKYDPTGHYLIFETKDGKAAIVMEEGEGKITDVRGGLEPAVEYVEGCL